jgi:low temperature requirement protein LtrA
MTPPQSSEAARIRGLLRVRGEDTGRVGMVELFFDLVFVFAVTQLSHTLLHDLTLAGLLRVSVLLFAVWWVWIYTSWVTNWLDPERIPVRVSLFVLMLAGLLLSVSIPHAFAERGIVFASAYVSMQVGRSLFFLWAVHAQSPRLGRSFQRIIAWFLLSSVFWIVGGLAPEGSRLAWWTLALAIDIGAPLVYYRVPGLGRSVTAEWDIDGNHMAERCALFVIIALGESLLVTGATFSETPWTTDTWTALILSVLSSILMWWIYFDSGAERAHHRIQHSHDPGRQARSAYTYLHVIIVGGIICSAVADELVLMHPAHAEAPAIAAILGAPFCFLLGTAAFKWVMNDRKAPPLSHLAGLGMLLALAWPALHLHLSSLLLSALATAVLLVVATWESIVVNRS